MKAVCLIFIALMLVSCGTAPSKESRKWLGVLCSGFANWTDCYRKESLSPVVVGCGFLKGFGLIFTPVLATNYSHIKHSLNLNYRYRNSYSGT